MSPINPGTRKATLCYLILWIMLILMVGILPLRNFVGHSHWEFIRWLPTADELQSPKYLLDIVTDLIGNTALFLPLGFLLSRLVGHAARFHHVIVAAVVAAVLSLGIELYQVYCHNRFPSIFDVVTNVGGALLGAHLSLTRPALFGIPVASNLTPIPRDRSPVP